MVEWKAHVRKGTLLRGPACSNQKKKKRKEKKNDRQSSFRADHKLSHATPNHALDSISLFDYIMTQGAASGSGKTALPAWLLLRRRHRRAEDAAGQLGLLVDVVADELRHRKEACGHMASNVHPARHLQHTQM